MQTVKSVAVKLSVDGYDDARLKIAKLSVASDELARQHPEITPQINSAKALIEARLLRQGIKKELSGSAMMSDLEGAAGGSGGLLGKLLGTAGSGGEAGSGVLGQLSSMPWPAIAAGAGAVALLLPELTGVVSGLAAAGAGVGAFGALAIPTFLKIKDAYTGISAAQTTYNNAVALQKADPTKANAKAASDALVKLKLAEDSLSPSTKTAVSGIQSLITGYQNMAKAFAPDAMKVFNAGLKIANTLLPDIKPFATAAGGAIDGLLGKALTFFKSADFRKWLGSFQKLVGPVIGAIGTGIGQVMIQVGKLFTLMSAKDDVNAIHLAFTIIGGSIHAVTLLVDGLMKGWHIAQVSILGDIKLIVDAGAKAFGWLPGIGPKLRAAQHSFDNWVAGINGGLGSIQGQANITSGMLAGVANAAINAFSKAKGAASLAGIGSASPHASGGPAGGLILVGERGPELLSVPGGSYVYNNRQTQQMTGGGNTYNISITLPNGADAQQGRRIVEAIRQFETGSGKSWRAS